MIPNPARLRGRSIGFSASALSLVAYGLHCEVVILYEDCFPECIPPHLFRAAPSLIRVVPYFF